MSMYNLSVIQANYFLIIFVFHALFPLNFTMKLQCLTQGRDSFVPLCFLDLSLSAAMLSFCFASLLPRVPVVQLRLIFRFCLFVLFYSFFNINYYILYCFMAAFNV